jgi:hypothetical protein
MSYRGGTQWWFLGGGATEARTFILHVSGATEACTFILHVRRRAGAVRKDFTEVFRNFSPSLPSSSSFALYVGDRHTEAR